MCYRVFPWQSGRFSGGRNSGVRNRLTRGKPVVRASASDNCGLVYAITELADRVRHATNPVAALTLAAPPEEQPANRARSINRAFVSDVEDESWFYDRDY